MYSGHQALPLESIGINGENEYIEIYDCNECKYRRSTSREIKSKIWKVRRN